MVRHKPSFVFLFVVFVIITSNIPEIKAQDQTAPLDPIKTPSDIEFTNQMSRARKDYVWSQTYYKSYRRTQEVPYLKLAGNFCLQSIQRLSNMLTKLSRTTKFYSMADEKRLQACRFYDKLQKESFILKIKDHLPGTGSACR